eukprot:scaffold434_cov186-Pinguiococcus_pyrenoidosus.AAC.114
MNQLLRGLPKDVADTVEEDLAELLNEGGDLENFVVDDSEEEMPYELGPEDGALVEEEPEFNEADYPDAGSDMDEDEGPSGGPRVIDDDDDENEDDEDKPARDRERMHVKTESDAEDDDNDGDCDEDNDNGRDGGTET